MCARGEGPLRGVTASAPTEQHNIHTLKLVERISVREKKRKKETVEGMEGRMWSVADYRVALTNILYLPSLFIDGGGQLVEHIPGRLAGGPRPSVPHWQATRGLQARIGSAARAGHLQSVGGATCYKRP